MLLHLLRHVDGEHLAWFSRQKGWWIVVTYECSAPKYRWTWYQKCWLSVDPFALLKTLSPLFGNVGIHSRIGDPEIWWFDFPAGDAVGIPKACLIYFENRELLVLPEIRCCIMLHLHAVIQEWDIMASQVVGPSFSPASGWPPEKTGIAQLVMAPPKKHWKFSCLHVLPSLEPACLDSGDLQNDGNKNQQRCGRAGRGLFSPCLVASNLLPTVSRILSINLCILLELTKRYLKGPKGVVTEDPWISPGGLTRLRPPWWMPLKMTRTGATLGCTQHGLTFRHSIENE